MTLLLAATGWNADPWLERFRRLLPGRTVVDYRAPYDPAAVRYVACWKPPRDLLAGLPNLAVIFNLGAGVDALLADPTLPDRPIVRIVNPDLTSRMRDYVVLHVLYHHRRMHRLADAQRRHDWVDFDQPAPEAVRVGILGFGALGRAAGRALADLGFQVAAWSRSGATEPSATRSGATEPSAARSGATEPSTTHSGATEPSTSRSGAAAPADITVFGGAAGLAPFLARTDILVVLLPLTAETRGLIDRAFLRGLAKDGPLGGAVLINAGRGGLQVEADILAALDDGTLLSATLDVFEKEPLDAASPLWDHPRVVVTPHNAADSDPEALAAHVAEHIGRYEAGLGLVDVVDRGRGY